MKKEEVFNILVNTGRKLVREKGADFLTARKLSDVSGCSVGTIYNQFGNMDNFILVQNMQTLDELYVRLAKIKSESGIYEKINRYLDAFVDFVEENVNLWALLYNFHLKDKEASLPKQYLRKIIEINELWESAFGELFSKKERKENKLVGKVLWLTLFSMTSFLTTNILQGMIRVNKKNVCKILLNTYLAGIRALKKR